MSSGEIGFLVGAIPGLTLVFRNMLALRRRIEEAEKLAKENGSFLDFNYSASSMKSDFLFRPGTFIKPDDEAGICHAKEHLLMVRRRTIKRHVVGGLVVMTGAILGSFLEASLWPGG
ncbi:hypothetical protein [Luteibacter sp. 9135]|uniref:hypothetical protein n=1 Tax=Luteibacter sp. 9135 TaxID=1500893 RepID=UPI00163B4A86|nr:hypothetical protein [Luteibacter sp. 9135]